MNTQKVAISIPADLVASIDTISKKRGLSRSRFISNVLQEKMSQERNRSIRFAYDRVFSDEDICREQLEFASRLEGTGNLEGQEW